MAPALACKVPFSGDTLFLLYPSVCSLTVVPRRPLLAALHLKRLISHPASKLEYLIMPLWQRLSVLSPFEPLVQTSYYSRVLVAENNLCNQSSFMLLNWSVFIILGLVSSLEIDPFFSLRTINKLPSIVFLDHVYFFIQLLSPIYLLWWRLQVFVVRL